MIISSGQRLKKIIEQAKRQNKKVLIKKGVFDIIHPGHIYAIKQFKKLADLVIIFIQSDSSTRREKREKRPINSQKQRAEVVEGLKDVDCVFMDKSETREETLRLLEELKPDIIAIVKFSKRKTEKYTRPYWELKEFPNKKKETFSTTRIINKIVKRYKL